MIKNLKKLTAVALTLSVLAGCGTRLNSSDFLSVGDAQFQANSNSTASQFVNLLESGDIIIDDEYYSKFPDAYLANQVIPQIQKGIVPQYPEKNIQSNAVEAQFFSLFNKKAVIDIYDSYGNEKEARITGRVYKKKKVSAPNTSDSKWKNLFRNIKFFTPDPISNLQLNIVVNGVSRTVTTDSKGFFEAVFNGAGFQPGIHKVTANILSSKYQYDKPSEQLLIDSSTSDKISIVSDIDDTVKYTGVDKKLDMVKKVFLGNYKTDKAIPGVAALYSSLISGSQGSANGCCVHYLTGSPIHLNSRIDQFLELNRFPEGSLNTKVTVLFYSGSEKQDQMNYKVSKIRPIVRLFPNRKFIFFGDTTQVDTEAYVTIKKEFPQNVAGIYINDVGNINPNDPRFKDVMLTKSAVQAAEDLHSKGLLDEAGLRRVIAEVKG